MKKLYPLPLLGILISVAALANGGDIRIQEEELVSERTERTRQKMRENPRNSSFPGSFGQIHPQNESQERQEEKGQWLDELTEDTYWDTGNSETTNKTREQDFTEL